MHVTDSYFLDACYGYKLSMPSTLVKMVFFKLVRKQRVVRKILDSVFINGEYQRRNNFEL